MSSRRSLDFPQRAPARPTHGSTTLHAHPPPLPAPSLRPLRSDPLTHNKRGTTPELYAPRYALPYGGRGGLTVCKHLLSVLFEPQPTICVLPMGEPSSFTYRLGRAWILSMAACWPGHDYGFILYGSHLPPHPATLQFLRVWL